MAKKPVHFGLGPSVRGMIARSPNAYKVSDLAVILTAQLGRKVTRQAVGKHVALMVRDKQARRVGRGAVERIAR